MTDLVRPRPAVWPCLALVGAWIATAPAAASELVTDRPDQTESASVMAPGEVQFELGSLLTHEEGSDIREVPGTLVRIGVVSGLELRLGWGGYVSQGLTESSVRDTGLGDAELGAKLSLWEESGARPQAALLAGVSLPTGSDGFSTGQADPSFRLSLAHGLSDDVGLGYNAGFEWETEEPPAGGSETRASFVYTAALGIGLTERLGVFAEAFGTLPTGSEEAAAHSLDGGVTLLLGEDLQLDAAAGVGLSDAAPDWFAGVGVSLRLR